MLTIEELKNLQVGDWVWIVDLDDNRGSYWYRSDRYILFSPMSENFKDFVVDSDSYTKTWVAFKNKEEAEGKSIALPYLLCTSNKFACVIWRDKDGKVKKTYTMPIDEAKGVLKEKEKLCNTND